MFKKICLLLMIGLVMIGVVFAADAGNFKIPDKFEDLGNGVYVLYKSDHKNADVILSIVDYNEHDWKDYTTNDTENKYIIFKGEDNIYNFTDGSVDEKGSFELIDVNGTKYIIDFSKTGIDNEKDFTVAYNRLLEFNKLNNLTPVEQ